MRLSLGKASLLLLFILITTKSTFAQEEPRKSQLNTYLEILMEEGYEVVAQGTFQSGDLPKDVDVTVEKYYKYRIIAIPSGKLKTVLVKEDGRTIMSSTKERPVLDWTHIPNVYYSTRDSVFTFMNAKRRSRGEFKLSSENSLQYIIAKKRI